MSNEVVVNGELKGKTQRLLDGPLKHVRAAALAAALLPLASIVATPASAQTAATSCPSGGTCGIVYNDTNGNGIIDVGDTPMEGVDVTACLLCNGTDNVTASTDLNGVFAFPVDACPSTCTIYVTIPTGTQASSLGPDNVGVSNGAGFSVATGVTLGSTANNFGFTPTAVAQPGTGTPGYWKNHPEAWPTGSITVGGVTYMKAHGDFLARQDRQGQDGHDVPVAGVSDAERNGR